MQKSLINLTKELQRLLSEWLPAMAADNWWNRYVLSSLSHMQRQQAEQRGHSKLSELDLAALLRVLDQNWFELSNHTNLPKEARNWLKETQSIRNRWAHAPADGWDDESTYRDLDTLERLQQAIGVSLVVLDDLRQEKQRILSKLAPNDVPVPQNTFTSQTAGIFALGTVICLKAQPSVTGAIIAHLPGQPEDRYQVFHDGSVTTYYASQIENLVQTGASVSLTPEELHATLSALQLQHPSTGHLYSLFASRVNFVPYQFRPVLKLIQADRPRLLIADEVGVGKTIEAGLILKELQARRELRSVLVICPKPLVAEKKWQEEMKRFDEQFIHLDGATFRYCIEETHLDGNWPQQYARAILPYSLLDETLLMGKQEGRKKQRGLFDLDPPPCFDLVIVDEAHHIRNTDTWAYRNVRYFCENAEAVVLLSATPIQLGNNDLFTLLNLLRPDVLPNYQAFEQMAEPNPFINQAIDAARTAQSGWQIATSEAIERAVATPWGQGVLTTNPSLQLISDNLKTDIDDNNRLALIRQLESIYTFSPFINRTRRRDIGSFTTRKPETVAVQFTPQQATLHHDLISLISRILAQRHGDQNLLFMMTTLRRQVASCIFGLAPLLKGMLDRHLSELEFSEACDFDISANSTEMLGAFRAEVNQLIQRASTLSDNDPKFDAFQQVIQDKQKLLNNKLLVFSTFRHTLAYLVKRLTENTIRLGLIHGDIPDDERRDLRHRFSLQKDDPQAIDLLLSSEVGCEGLDFQFCDGMVNYDLPWNPMRVEQRIGRIDRYGQKSETVVIYNLVTPGTVDAEIYNRCLLRIGVFRQALGGSEEILGKLTREIHDIAENLSLTPEEQAQRLQQLAENEIRAVQEQSQLEEAQSKFFGLSVPKQDAALVRQASSFWLAPDRLANLVERYLEKLEPGKAPRKLNRKSACTLQFGLELRDKLLADFQALKLGGSTAQNWQRWLKGNAPYLTLTFDAATAVDRRDIDFITPAHPLARQAAQSFTAVSILSSNFLITTDKIAPGHYPYAIYRWRKLGMKEDFAFQPVSIDPMLGEHLLEMIESAQAGDQALTVSSEEKEMLEQTHYQQWSQARAEHIEQINNQIQAQLASLETTHTARLALLQEQLDSASEPKIRRMREAQIESAKRDQIRRSDELKQALVRGDILAEALVYGILVVETAQ